MGLQSIDSPQQLKWLDEWQKNNLLRLETSYEGANRPLVGH